MNFLYYTKYMHTWNSLMFMDATSPMMEWLIMFHDFTLFINILITMTILYSMFSLMYNNFINLKIENQMIEIIWTIVPMIILIYMAIPSLKILYLMDEIYNPVLTIKCIGHQWFWTYEYSDFNNILIESYMIKSLNNTYSFRLLDTYKSLCLPIKTELRMIISSEDVIHSFTIPSMAIKLDAIPGRLNQSNLFILQTGNFFGQCSEICGANHSFMPIKIESLSIKSFFFFINNSK